MTVSDDPMILAPSITNPLSPGDHDPAQNLPALKDLDTSGFVGRWLLDRAVLLPVLLLGTVPG